MNVNEITVAHLREEVMRKRKRFLPLRSCSICNVAIGYHVDYFGEEGPEVVFISNCACSSAANPRISSYGEILENIRIQSTDEIREKVARDLGLGSLLEQ